MKASTPNIGNILTLLKTVLVKVPSYLLQFCGTAREGALPTKDQTQFMSLIDVRSYLKILGSSSVLADVIFFIAASL